MNDILITVVSSLVTLVVLPLIGLGGKALLNYLNTKIKNNKLKEALSQVAVLAEKSVDMIAQTFVDDLKKQGKFDKNTQTAALNYAVNNVKELLTPEVLNLLGASVENIDLYLTTLIESYVKKSKEGT